jgi:hypothetical protein
MMLKRVSAIGRGAVRALAQHVKTFELMQVVRCWRSQIFVRGLNGSNGLDQSALTTANYAARIRMHN